MTQVFLGKANIGVDGVGSLHVQAQEKTDSIRTLGHLTLQCF